MGIDKDNSKCTGADTPKNFSSFKDMRKSTMGETYKNLQALIENTEFHSSESFKELLSSSSSLSVFDECLYTMLVDRLQLRNEVIKILLSQNDDQIKRILQCKWFFKDLPSQFCTSELFPHVSFSLRCKIITKLSKHLEDESEAEKYFLFIRRQYSNQRADFLLPKCSSQFILNHFQKDQLLFEHPAGVRILLNICKRHPETGLHILTCIFDLKKNSFNLAKYKSTFLYMAANHSDLFIPFIRKYYLQMGCETFGRKLTKKLGRKLREYLFSDFENISVFKSKQLFCMLPFDEKVKFLASIVGSQQKTLSFQAWTRSRDKMCELLKLIRPSERLAMIEATFTRLYNLNFKDHSKCWCSGLLELLPVDKRFPFAIKLENFFVGDRKTFDSRVDSSFNIEAPDHLIHLYEFRIAFRKFKEILRQAPHPSRRQKILLSMVRNCSINADVEGLQEIVDFVATHHRNDDSNILYGFIQAICDEFPWTALTTHIFQKLEDLIDFCTLRGSPDPHVHMQWKERYIYHLMENGMEVDAQMKDYLENVIVRTCYYRFIQDYKCQHSRTLLLAVGEMAVKRIRKNSSDNENNTLLFCTLRTCADFDEAHRGSQVMKDIPGLEELLCEKIKAKFGDLGAEEWPLDVWGRYYGEVMSARYDLKCLLWVLKRRPDLIKSHLEGFVNCLCNYFCKTHKNFCDFFVKAASFFDKTEKLKELLLKEFRGGKANDIEALVMFSKVSTIEDFGEVVENYLPKQEEIEKGSDSRFGKIQLSIPLMIKNIKPRWKNFDLILKFFKGDFLKQIRSSLYSCSFHTRVDVVIPFLKKHMDSLPRKVSYQKDIIRLIAELCTRDERLSFCLKCWDDYNHYSIRTALFTFISEQFIEQPTRESFRALEKCILKSDPNIIVKMPSIQKVPGEFLEDYIYALLRFSEGETPAFRNDFQQSILSRFHANNINLLSPEFCDEIIKKNLFNPNSELQVREFARLYVMADPNAMSTRIRSILGLIRDTNADCQCVSSFFHTLIESSREESSFADLITVVLEHWPRFPVGFLYEDRLLFTYHSLHQKVLRRGLHSDVVTAEFAKELQRLFIGVENLRDLVVVFAEALNRFFGNFETLEAILTVKELVTTSRDRPVIVLGILALPGEAINCFRQEEEIFSESVAKSKAALKELVRVLEKYCDEVIDIFIMKKFFG